MAYIMLGILDGMFMPVQTGINMNLRRRFGSPFIAAEISFTVGFIFMVLVFLFQKDGSAAISFRDLQGQPLWMWAGGVLGMIVLTGNILLLPKIGSVQTVVFPVFGLIISGLILDHFALFGAVHKPVTFVRAAGAFLAFAGVVLITAVKNRNTGKTAADNGVWLWHWLR